MEISKALELLKKYLGELEHLRTPPYNNNDLERWKNKIDVIVEEAFSKNSDEYGYLHPSGMRVTSFPMFPTEEEKQKEKQRYYLSELSQYEMGIQKILDKHEILGVESKRLPTKEPWDTVNLALHTFDAKEYLKIYENLGGRIVGNEFEVALLGTVDMTIECMMHFTKKLNSQGLSYKSNPRIGGHPDYAKPDRTCFATCNITETTEGTEKQIGTIELQLLPNERTLLKASHPKDWVSSFKYFLDALFAEFEQLGYIKKEKKAIVEALPPEALTAKPNWKDIQSEFGITKMGFGKRINFIKGPFKRTIIFRDAEHAFILASLGFSKPAVILAGGVIEELLRLYLEHKNITPINNSFDGYIQTCEEKGLLKVGISRLSDSARYFRNLVHLSKEETKSHTVTKSAAKGAVASIFTIANDF